MIKGKFGLAKFIRWFKCIILDKHEESKLPHPLVDKFVGKVRVEIYKCRFCGRTRRDYL